MQQLRASQYGRQRIVEIVSHARSQLTERPQLICPGGALAFFLLLRDIAGDTQDTSGAAIHDQRRLIDPGVAHLSIASKVTKLAGLGQAPQCIRQFLTYQFAIVIADHFQQVPANKVFAGVAKSAQGGAVTPLETALRVDRID